MNENNITFQKINQRKHLDEIAILRALAMFAVVAIHFINMPLLRIPETSSAQIFYYYFQKLLIFAVPCFIFISGLMVSYKQPQGKLNTKVFYIKRLKKVGIPYLIWTLLYLVILLVLGSLSLADLGNLQNWATWLGLGKAYEHLYFMIIILEFYLLAPILLPLAQKTANSLPWALVIAFGGQMIVYWLNRLFIYDSFPHVTTTYFWYWAVGFMGLWLGVNYEKNLEFLKKHKKPLIIIFICALIGYCGFNWPLYLQIKFDTFIYTGNLYFYIISTICLLLLLCCIISKIKNRKLKSFLKWIGDYSYGIYLIHPIFTFVLRYLLRFENPVLWFFVTVAGVILLSAFCGLLVQWLQKNKIIGIAFGNWPK